MPLKNEQERQEVLRLLDDGVKYKYIMEKYDIGKSSLSEYKKKLNEGKIKIKETTKPKDEKKEKTTELTEQKKIPLQDKKKIAEKPKSKTPKPEPIPITRVNNIFFTETEFKIFETSVILIENSNRKRYKSGNAHGMIQALNNITMIKDKIKKEGKF